MMLFSHYREEKPKRPVIIARHTTARVEHRRGGDQISLGNAGVLELDLSTQISLRDALTASIAQHGDRTGGWAA